MNESDLKDIRERAKAYAEFMGNPVFLHVYETGATEQAAIEAEKRRAFAEFVWDRALDDAQSEVERIVVRPWRERLITRVMRDFDELSIPPTPEAEEEDRKKKIDQLTMSRSK